MKIFFGVKRVQSRSSWDSSQKSWYFGKKDDLQLYTTHLFPSSSLPKFKKDAQIKIYATQQIGLKCKLFLRITPGENY